MKVYKLIANKSREEINSNEKYKIIDILFDMTWWGDPDDMPDMGGRKKIFDFINTFALKYNIEISCKELLDPNYKEWCDLAVYICRKLERVLLDEV